MIKSDMQLDNLFKTIRYIASPTCGSTGGIFQLEAIICHNRYQCICKILAMQDSNIRGQGLKPKENDHATFHPFLFALEFR